MTEILSLESLRRRAARAFWQAEAIRFASDEPFELASGNRSPIYINCRLLISDPDFMRLFTRAAGAILAQAGVTPQAVAGGETAGIPYAAYLARDLNLPMLYVRKKAKGYGIASKVEGRLQEGWRVLLVEDLVTDGGSKMGFVEALRAGGGEVADILVLFDRLQGAETLLADRGLRLHSVTDRQMALEEGEALGTLSTEDREQIEAYFADTAGWHAERGYSFNE